MIPARHAAANRLWAAKFQLGMIQDECLAHDERLILQAAEANLSWLAEQVSQV